MDYALDHDASLEDWLRLALIAGLGAASHHALLRAYGTPKAVLNASHQDLSRRVGSRLADAVCLGTTANAVDVALQWARLPNHALLTLADHRYPALLREISDPPILLYLRGERCPCELLRRPALAIVGSRHASAQGLRDAHEFAGALARRGFAIVSGLALGIDAAAHAGALDANGATIAVIGTGIDIGYPRRNNALAQRIATDGAIISEFALGSPPLAQHFPRRNRIISGLAQGCVVIEAAIDSGSLITARLAADQGREVFALPGSIHSPLAKGCHALIRDGAKLVDCVDHIIEELQPATTRSRSSPSPKSITREPEHPLLSEMGYAPTDIDTLCARSSLTPDVVSAMLLSLEMTGAVAALAGGRYQRLA